MYGVTFEDKHSYDDYSLILNSKEIEVPEVKTEVVNIPGADGQLDLTEYFGSVKYENRKISMTFTRIGSRAALIDCFSEIQNALHGQKKKIIFDDDATFFYNGRVFVEETTFDRGYGTIKISADCEPYKNKISETTVSGTGAVTLTNLKKPVSPKITTTAAVTIAWEGGSASVPVGTDLIVPEFVLHKGNNAVTVTGGTATFKYREGEL